MKDRICPNCGNVMPGSTTNCECGFSWNEGTDMPAPNIVRSAVGQPSAVDQLPSTGDRTSPASRKNDEAEVEMPLILSGDRLRATTSGKPAPPEPRIVNATDTLSAQNAPPNAAFLMACPTCNTRISKRATMCPKCKSAPYSQCLICTAHLLVSSNLCNECGDPDPFTSPVGGEA